RDLDELTAFFAAHALEVLYAVAPLDAPEDLRFLIEPILGQQNGHRASEDLGRRVAVNALRSGVPGENRALERLADDRVLGGLHDSRQMGHGTFGIEYWRDDIHTQVCNRWTA